MTLLDNKTIKSAMLRPVDDLLEESGYPAIVLDLNSLSLLDEDALQQVERWSRQQPCPVIGFGPEHSAAVVCVDAAVENHGELGTMLRRIASNPQASTVLVQVLRAIEHLSPAEGLIFHRKV